MSMCAQAGKGNGQGQDESIVAANGGLQKSRSRIGCYGNLNSRPTKEAERFSGLENSSRTKVRPTRPYLTLGRYLALPSIRAGA